MTKTCNTAYESVIHAVVAERLQARVLTLTPIPTVQDTIVYAVATDAGAFIFKTIDPAGRDPDGIAAEAQVCTLATRAGVPVPSIVVLDTTCTHFPAAFFVMEQARGQPLANLVLTDTDKRQVYDQLGPALRRLHALPLSGFGWLDEARCRATGVLAGQAASWADALYGAVPASMAYLATHTDLTAREVAALERVLGDSRPSIAAYTEGRLLHGDLGRLHVWIDPATLELTAIIDWGERRVGDPLWDFVDYEWDDLSLLWEAYAPGTAVVTSEPRFYQYAVLRAIPWAAKWHARGGTHVLNWLRLTLRHATAAAGRS